MNHIPTRRFPQRGMDLSLRSVTISAMNSGFQRALTLLASGLCAAMLTALPASAATLGTGAILRSSFIDDTPVVPSAHASTLVETPEGLVAAWFAGTEEGALDVGIWLSRNQGAGWSNPEEIANGLSADGRRRFPCWNPVLVQRRNGDLLLFYRVGPDPTQWWTFVRASRDNGQTWTRLRQLPDGFLGPIKNKPLELPNGLLLCGSSTEHGGWRVHLEWTTDPFGMWFRSKPLNSAFTLAAIQPTLLQHDARTFQLLCRTKQGYIAQAWSTNAAADWSRLTRTVLPNPNSGLDAVRLRDGRLLLAYNHSTNNRSRLNLALSYSGHDWHAAALLENEPDSEFSYPAIIQTADGLVHLTYTWKREKIKHVVIDPDRLESRPMPAGRWPE